MEILLHIDEPILTVDGKVKIDARKIKEGPSKGMTPPEAYQEMGKLYFVARKAIKEGTSVKQALKPVVAELLDINKKELRDSKIGIEGEIPSNWERPKSNIEGKG